MPGMELMDSPRAKQALAMELSCQLPLIKPSAFSHLISLDSLEL